MRRTAAAHTAPSLSLPDAVLELCAHLESHGVPTAVQGEALLRELRPCEADAGDPASWALVCGAAAERVLRALPRAVVTAPGATRLTQPTPVGPVDLLCLGEDGEASLERGLERFALGPLALALRPAREAWIDPHDQLARFTAGRLSLVPSRPEAFREAPRRLWIAARLIAEHALEPEPFLVERARAGCAETALALPIGAPARRAMTRILAVKDPTRALAFLEATGVTSVVAPGAHPVHAGRIQRLPAEPAIRWAAWLRGTATTRAMVTFRMPHPLARRIERAQASHPLDRMEGHDREPQLRRLIARLSPGEIDALILWRRIELECAADAEAARLAGARLDDLEAEIVRQRARAAEGDRRRHLALDGEDVMQRLDAGPGRHVGAALGHLARIVATDPEANTRAHLERALDAWAKAHPELLERARSARRDAIG